jgi:hypothetical protein
MNIGHNATETHQSKPPHILIVPEIHPKIEVIHELENESHWVPGRRVHSDERGDVLVPEAAVRQRFFIESLSIYHQSTGHTPQMRLTT